MEAAEEDSGLHHEAVVLRESHRREIHERREIPTQRVTCISILQRQRATQPNLNVQSYKRVENRPSLNLKAPPQHCHEIVFRYAFWPERSHLNPGPQGGGD